MPLICMWECSLQIENADGIGSKVKGCEARERRWGLESFIISGDEGEEINA